MLPRFDRGKGIFQDRGRSHAPYTIVRPHHGRSDSSPCNPPSTVHSRLFHTHHGQYSIDCKTRALTSSQERLLGTIVLSIVTLMPW